MISLKRFLVKSPGLKIPARILCTSPVVSSSMLVVHRDSRENNPRTPFEFTKDNLIRLNAIVKNYPKGAQRSAVIAYLDVVQRQLTWVPISAMHKVAELLDIPRMRVYEISTFYTMMKRRPHGKYHVQICTCTPCWLRGSDWIVKAAEDACCCKLGEVSCDGMFGLSSVECQGACVNAPLMVIDDDYYEDLHVADVHNIINAIKSGCIPQAGPQGPRTCAEPITGPNTLLFDPQPPDYKLQKKLQPPC